MPGPSSAQVSEFEQNLCCGSESEEANLASLRETLALPGLRPVDVKRALCLYALKYGRSSKLNPREVQIVAESKSHPFLSLDCAKEDTVRQKLCQARNPM